MDNILQNKTLAPLFERPLFRSDVRVEAHDFVSQEFADHALRWRTGVPDAAMFKAAFNKISIYALEYGPEVEIEAQPFDDFVLVHTSLQGGMELDCDGQSLWVREGSTAVLAPSKRLHLRWSRKSRQLIFKIPRALLDSVASADAGREDCMNPAFLLSPQMNQQWKLLVQAVGGVLPSSTDTEVSPRWTAHLETAIATFVLVHKPAPAFSKTGFAPVSAAAPPSIDERDTVTRLVSFIDEHLSDPISLEDFTRATGLGVRSINVLCQRQFGMSPMELVRNRRLDAVHRRLLLDPNASVTETALDYGFGHLGRFSAYYEARFRKLPRETQKAARRD
jgi:AraC-like DNA-binding protein